VEKNEPLKNVVKKIIKSLEDKEKKNLDMLKIWENAAGEKASRHTKPVFSKSKKLVVNVSDSSWLYKLTLEKDGLLRKINAEIPNKKRIRELQFRIGDIR